MCFRVEENDRMDRDRREQAKQHQKQQMKMQRLSQQSDDLPQLPLFGVPKKVRFLHLLKKLWMIKIMENHKTNRENLQQAGLFPYLYTVVTIWS